MLGTFIPNALRLNFFIEMPASEDDEELLGNWLLASVSATVEIDPDNPIETCISHPQGKSVDLVAIPLVWDVSQEFLPVCLNFTPLKKARKLELGDDVFTVGFPEGTEFDRRLPLWKRGSIATDPDLNQNSRPQFYVDTIGNFGLSGSPVLHRTSRVPDSSEGQKSISKEYSFVGIYAGRLGETGIHSQIGRIVKASALTAIFRKNPNGC